MAATRSVSGPRPRGPGRRLLSAVANTAVLVVGTLVVLPVYLLLLLPAGLLVLVVVRLARRVRGALGEPLPAEPRPRARV